MGQRPVVEHAAASSLDGLHEALARARVHRAAGRDVLVQLHGRYELDSTLDLGAELQSASDGMAHHGAVTLRGPAVLDGGVQISGWVKDPARPWLFVAKVPAALQGTNVTQARPARTLFLCASVCAAPPLLKCCRSIPGHYIAAVRASLKEQP